MLACPQMGGFCGFILRSGGFAAALFKRNDADKQNLGFESWDALKWAKSSPEEKSVDEVLTLLDKEQIEVGPSPLCSHGNCCKWHKMGRWPFLCCFFPISPHVSDAQPCCQLCAHTSHSRSPCLLGFAVSQAQLGPLPWESPRKTQGSGSQSQGVLVLVPKDLTVSRVGQWVGGSRRRVMSSHGTTPHRLCRVRTPQGAPWHRGLWCPRSSPLAWDTRRCAGRAEQCHLHPATYPFPWLQWEIRRDYLPLVTCHSGFGFAESLIREPLLGVYPHAGASLSTLCNTLTSGIKHCSMTKLGWMDS